MNLNPVCEASSTGIKYPFNRQSSSNYNSSSCQSSELSEHNSIQHLEDYNQYQNGSSMPIRNNENVCRPDYSQAMIPTFYTHLKARCRNEFDRNISKYAKLNDKAFDYKRRSRNKIQSDYYSSPYPHFKQIIDSLDNENNPSYKQTNDSLEYLSLHRNDKCNNCGCVCCICKRDNEEKSYPVDENAQFFESTRSMVLDITKPPPFPPCVNNEAGPCEGDKNGVFLLKQRINKYGNRYNETYSHLEKTLGNIENTFLVPKTSTFSSLVPAASFTSSSVVSEPASTLSSTIRSNELSNSIVMDLRPKNAGPSKQTAFNDKNLNNTLIQNSNCNLSIRNLTSKIMKRKSISARYGVPKIWNKEAAIRALQLEEIYESRYKNTCSLILRFPDPDLNRDIVKGFSSDICNVQFLHSSASRYCTVQLRPGANVEKVIETISKIPFGNGFVRAEKKKIFNANVINKPEHIDPYTLYVGNLSDSMNRNTLRDQFPTSSRIDIGFSIRMKKTRYAFVRFHTVEDALNAYENAIDFNTEKRSIFIRFRRIEKPIFTKETDAENAEVIDTNLPYDLPNECNNFNDLNLSNDLNQDYSKDGSSCTKIDELNHCNMGTQTDDSDLSHIVSAATQTDSQGLIFSNISVTDNNLSCNEQTNVLKSGTNEGVISQKFCSPLKTEPYDDSDYDELPVQSDILGKYFNEHVDIEIKDEFSIPTNAESLNNVISDEDNDWISKNERKLIDHEQTLSTIVRSDNSNFQSSIQSYNYSYSLSNQKNNLTKIHEDENIICIDDNDDDNDMESDSKLLVKRINQSKEENHIKFNSSSMEMDEMRERSAFIKRLYNEVHSLERNKTSRDYDNDDIFNRLNSDSEDDDFNMSLWDFKS